MSIRMHKHTKKAVAVLAGFFLVTTAACNTDELLEVDRPDLVIPENIQGAKGAELYWAGALGQFAGAYSSGGGGQAVYSGMLADEFHLSGTFPTRNQVDRREIDERNGTMLGQYRSLHQARVGLKNAAEFLQADLPGDPRIAEMMSLEAYTYVFFAENYCSGVPFGDTPPDGALVQGTPTTTAEMLSTAAAKFDAAAAATGGSADQQYLAAVGKARVLLNQGQYSSAASAVASVPTDWQYLVRSKGGGDFGQRNAIYELNSSQRRWSLSDGEGGNGILFRTNTDARVPWFHTPGKKGFDEETDLYEQTKYDSWDSDTPLASGIEARLIEAEAQLNSGDAAGMIATLNALRATMGLADLADPGSESARVDLLFEERARWLFGTSHRLGDMRRLVRQYGRSADSVFPTGDYFKGGTYGPDVNFPIPFEENENENYRDAGGKCIDRSA
ncbi:MAG: RagB/SusD family nutrient uptake outer membrane protein [Gemmatimonadota bacterium]